MSLLTRAAWLSMLAGLMLHGVAEAEAVTIACQYRSIVYHYAIDYDAGRAAELGDDGAPKPDSSAAAKISDRTVEWTYSTPDFSIHNLLNRYTGELRQQVFRGDTGGLAGDATFQCSAWSPHRKF